VERVRHHDTVEVGKIEAPREIRRADKHLGLRHGRDEGAAELRERGAIAIDGVDDAMRADKIGERERERASPGTEVGPRAAFALRHAGSEQSDVIRVVHPLAQLALAPAIGRKHECHRPIRLDADPHRGAEPTLTHLHAAPAKRAAKRVEQALPKLRRGGRGEIGSATVASVAIERELRHGEDHAADIGEAALHPPGFLEDAQAGDLRGKSFAILGTVRRADPDEDDDTGFDLGHALVADVDGGSADALDDRAR
jgi:hypothetical protein